MTDQDQLVVQALTTGEGARAEKLMRERADIGLGYSARCGLPDALDGDRQTRTD